MAKSLILRREQDLPSDVRALLHGPSPDGVWYLPSHPRVANPFRLAAMVSLVVLVAVAGLFVSAVFDSWKGGRFRSEGLIITGSMSLFAAGFHWICRRSKKNAERLEADLESGRVRFGLWITSGYALLHDYEGLYCARRQDIATVETYHGGLRIPDLLRLTLSNRYESIRVIVNSLDGWAGQTDKLRDTVDERLKTGPGISSEQLRNTAVACRQQHNDFNQFVRWLDAEAQRLGSGQEEKAALLAMADAALASWPDAARSPINGDFMFVESNGVWEYGVNSDSGSDTLYRGFRKNDASWLLPLSRNIYFFEAESIFPDVASVHDCAATFQNVPISEIHFKGGMEPAVFDAFLAWVASKPVKVLDGSDYRPKPNSLSNLQDTLKTQLADFKRRRSLA